MCKKTLVLFVALSFILFGSVSYADPDAIGKTDDDKEKKTEEKYKPFECPKTHMTNQEKCFTCHVPPTFKVKEADPHKLREYPFWFMKVYKDKDGEYGYLSFISEVDHNSSAKHFEEFFRYLQANDIKRAIIEIQSFGGSVFEGWRIKGIIDEFQCCGIDVTTKVQSIAASAATLVFLAANKRIISPTAELMFHELWTFDFLKISSPSDKEDEARVLRHIQDGITSWVATRGKLSKSEIDSKIKKKELWVNGTEAVELGFATNFIGK